jgi:hypothetical protein
MATKRKPASIGTDTRVSACESPRVVVGKSKEISAFLKQTHSHRVLAITFDSEQELAVAEEIYRRVGEVLPQLIRSRQQEKVSRVVEALLPEMALSRSALIQARMQAEAKAQILASGDYVRATEIAKLAGYSETNPSAQTSKWKREKAIFSVEMNGVAYFPFFALNPEKSYKPYPAVGDVLDVFQDTKTGWGLAFWFAGLNSFLDDQRPQDLLATRPEMVIEAAKDAMDGLTHG